MNREAKWLVGLVVSMFVGCVILASIVLILLFRDAGHLILRENPVKVLTPIVTPGSLMRYRISYCVDGRVPLPASVSRELNIETAEGETYQLASFQYVIRSQCESFIRPLYIPDYVPPGRYHLHLYTVLRANAFSRTAETFETEPFTVVPR